MKSRSGIAFLCVRMFGSIALLGLAEIANAQALLPGIPAAPNHLGNLGRLGICSLSSRGSIREPAAGVMEPMISGTAETRGGRAPTSNSGFPESNLGPVAGMNRYR
jgi:hypothetical protein